jgi:hypothetical protein
MGISRRELITGAGALTTGILLGSSFGNRPPRREEIPKKGAAQYVDCLVTDIRVAIYTPKGLAEHNQVALEDGWNERLVGDITVLHCRPIPDTAAADIYTGDDRLLGRVDGNKKYIVVPERFIGKTKFTVRTTIGDEITRLVVPFLSDRELLDLAVETYRKEITYGHSNNLPTQIRVTGPGNMYMPRVVDYSITGPEALTGGDKELFKKIWEERVFNP